MEVFDTIIVGAGAAGLMAGAHLSHQKVLLLEAQPRVAQKVAIAGGGRCNFTNVHVDASHYLGDSTFVSSVLEEFDNRAVLAYVKRHSIATVCEKNDQYFCAQSAKNLIDALLRDNAHHTLKTNTSVKSATKKGDLFTLDTTQGTYQSRHLLIATGGASYPKIGGNESGLALAKSFGHSVNPFESVLVGWTLQSPQAWMRDLSGVSLRATVRVGEKAFTDWLLFAHKGISGPAVLSASLYWKRGSVSIDFLPDFALKELSHHPKKLLANALPLPHRLALALLEALEIPNVSYKSLDKSALTKLSLLKAYTFAPAGTFGLSKAEACRGGVATDEIDASSMQSRIIEGLFFAGEVVDVTGELGGYNIQWAFSSAVCAAKALAKA
ncbi:MAG: hypothetical protein KU28_01685 [Sulfurovum sp. PC08-66]|nr:MAG: hypothetical protein KU28_01685 [Sulfurovum sp. PC08-66]KIM12648.1 MAG: hypothetical protein KU37_01790 [Sulfuricurvum sp. PC08-66]